MSGAWVHIMTNRPNGTLYLGVTTNLARRVWKHREGVVRGFTKTYGLKRLVHAEQHATVADAIQRESTMKHWRRAWKVRLILERNPGWADLYGSLVYRAQGIAGAAVARGWAGPGRPRPVVKPS